MGPLGLVYFMCHPAGRDMKYKSSYATFIQGRGRGLEATVFSRLRSTHHAGRRRRLYLCAGLKSWCLAWRGIRLLPGVRPATRSSRQLLAARQGTAAVREPRTPSWSTCTCVQIHQLSRGLKVISTMRPRWLGGCTAVDILSWCASKAPET